MGSGGWWSSHPKDFWNWSHGLFTNGASFSSVALRRAWAGKVEHHRQAAAAVWAESPSHSHVPQSCAWEMLCSWQAPAATAKCWRKRKCPGCLLCLSCGKPGWLSLSGGVVGKGKPTPPFAAPPWLRSSGGRGDRAEVRTPSVLLTPLWSLSFVFLI